MRNNLSKRRSGLSLMEILAAVFVIAIGIMGIIMVIPFGTFHMAKMNRADFSGNCGRAAMAELRVREWSSDPFTFLMETDQSHLVTWYENLTTVDKNFTAHDTYCISTSPFIVDPLNAEPDITNSSLDQIRRFRFLFAGDGSYATHAPYQFYDPSINDPGGLNPNLQSTTDAMDGFKDRFIWGDDIPYVPGNGNERPEMTVTDAKSHGYYTWFFMVTPNVNSEGTALYGLENNGDLNKTYVAYSDVVSFNVDIIVSQRRGYLSDDDDERASRILDVTSFSGSGKSGGGITVGLSSTAPAGIDEESIVNFDDYKNIDWVLLSGRYSDLSVYAKWFRLVSKGVPYKVGDDYRRDLMLIGPDIPYSDLTDAKLHLFEGVSHVYSETVPKKQ